MIDWEKFLDHFFHAMSAASASFAAISLGVGIFEGKISGLLLSLVFILALGRSIK